MATTYSQVSYGSKGSDVKTLQELLNQNGYSLDVDGVFGSKTQEAVKDYQTKNKLAVDGIAGNETWGSLSGGKSSSGSSSQAGAAASGFSYNAYKPSDTVQQAQTLLQQQMANKPGAYNSAWADQISGLIDQFTNREDFSYDLNGDALYQQYADQYKQQGKMAMMDTMGQAAALTGGYGNSYAQAVGQQAYQGYLQQLNEVVPELYGMALDQYNQEGQDMLNQYSLLSAQDEMDYGRHRDEVSDYYTQLQQMQDTYYTERDFDYGQWADGRDFGYGQYIDDRNYQYQVDRDKVADEQWQKEYDEAVRQWNHANGISSGSSSGSSGGKTGGTDKTGTPTEKTGTATYPQNGSLTQGKVKTLQKVLGVTQDGIYGADTKAAAKGLSADEAYNVYVLGKNADGTPKSSTPQSSTPTYESIGKDLNTYIKNGSSKSEINNYIRLAYQQGYINAAQYKDLKDTYAPAGYTY